jgi:hypothetical protein
MGRVGRISTFEKACRPTLRNFDSDSNATEESDLQSAKQHSSKNLTDEGRMISIKLVPKNAHCSIRDNLDPDSNLTEESDPQEEKHFSHKTSINAERMISIKLVS